MSIQSARSRKGAEPGKPVWPPKPEEVRYGIVCLYGAAFISLCFLIMNGDVQWQESAEQGLVMMQAALVHMIVCFAVDAGTGFALSRHRGWARPVLMICVGAGLAVHALAFQDLILHSPGLFITRILSLFMEVAAILFLLRPRAKAWFAALPRDPE